MRMLASLYPAAASLFASQPPSTSPIGETINDMLASPWNVATALLRYLATRRGLFATPSLTGLAYVSVGALSLVLLTPVGWIVSALL